MHVLLTSCTLLAPLCNYRHAATEMDGRQEYYLKLHYGSAKPKNEALCKEELSSWGLQVGTGNGLGTQPPKLSLGQCSARGTGFVATLLQTTQFWCPCGTAHREDNFPFCLPSCRLLEYNRPAFLKLSRSLDPLLKLSTWQSYKRQVSLSTMLH